MPRALYLNTNEIHSQTNIMNNIANGIIEVDDIGPGYETDASKNSETTSLASSLQEYLVENGMRKLASIFCT